MYTQSSCTLAIRKPPHRVNTMKWVISKNQNKQPYFLKRVSSTGRAVWTPAEGSAIHYHTKKAAEYTISYARLTNVSIHRLVNGVIKDEKTDHR